MLTKKNMSIKRIVVLLTLVLTGFLAKAQIYDPVKWSTAVEKISDTEYDLVITAAIETNWHLYAQNVPEDGPIPTTFTFNPSEGYELVGSTSEEEGHTVDDPIFLMKIKYFDTQATFKQRIKLLTDSRLDISGEVEFMVCDDTQCLPPTYEDLNFTIDGKAGSAA